jgi:hypothetical protein
VLLETRLAQPLSVKQIACFGRAGIAAGDPALCERIANPDVKSVCAFDPERLE